MTVWYSVYEQRVVCFIPDFERWIRNDKRIIGAACEITADRWQLKIFVTM
jgi:hypothetical protein